MDAPSLQRDIVAMADSRREVTLQPAGLDDMVDYRLRLEFKPANNLLHTTWVYGTKAFHNKFPALTENGFEMVGFSRLGGDNTWVDVTDLVNILSAHGYKHETSSLAEQLSRTPCKQQTGADARERLFMVIRVPRSLILAAGSWSYRVQ
eukprot:TRINITY_DN103073_c0_g1_i1.p1 TRINITY_DN103073_c0_g1~~TRINITY_DN103073_c0_g1_i1.p1  ORF type:complete len:149 (+),score=10.55 TRINITY_DN103073_c0_g1_i1:196-642(+)